MNKKIIAVVILASIVAVAAIGAYYALQKKQPATPRAVQTGQNQDVMGAQVITLTENGYEPSEVSIRKGETVTFKNTTGKLFWPASNLHPSHGIYPEFDPAEPIPADGMWSFTFEKSGEWKFHDHLAPYFTGVITVSE